MPFAVGSILPGNIRLIKQIGAGELFVSFAAEHEPTKRPLYCKVQRDDLSTAMAEAAVDTLSRWSGLRELRPAGVPTVLYAGEWNGSACIVTEWIPGKSLHDLGTDAGLRAEIGSGFPSLLLWRCLEALSTLHVAGLWHGNLSASNILLPEGMWEQGHLPSEPVTKVWLIDPAQATIQGSVTNNREWAAPEVLSGEEPGPWSDVYSLGMIVAGFCSQIGEPKPPSLELLTRHEPDDRPQNARQATNALFEIWKQTGHVFSPSAPREAPPPRSAPSGGTPIFSSAMPPTPRIPTLSSPTLPLPPVRPKATVPLPPANLNRLGWLARFFRGNKVESPDNTVAVPKTPVTPKVIPEDHLDDIVREGRFSSDLSSQKTGETSFTKLFAQANLESSLKNRTVENRFNKNGLTGCISLPALPARPASAESLEAASADALRKAEILQKLELLSSNPDGASAKASEEAYLNKTRRDGMFASIRSSENVDRREADFIVMGPTVIACENTFPLELWVGPSIQGAELRERAGDRGRLMERGATSKIGLCGSVTITAILNLPGFDVANSTEQIHWDGSIRNTAFLVSVAPDKPPGRYSGLIKLVVDTVPLGMVSFSIEIAARRDSAIPVAEQLSTPMQRHRTAFASYSRRNTAEVFKRVQAIRAGEIDIFVDIASLRGGDRWQNVLMHEIASRDTFFLFWSREAKKSAWVEREWKEALNRRGLDFICPIPLEDPRFAEPPQELQDLHFNDWCLAIIRGEEVLTAGIKPEEPGLQQTLK